MWSTPTMLRSATVVFLMLLATGCATREVDDLLSGFRARFPLLSSGVYVELGVWVDALGEPSTVAQLDGGETYFYWPRHGVAAFTHPLFEGQYARKARNERLVTSVILPLRSQYRPAVVAVSPETRAIFDRPTSVLFRRRPLPEWGAEELSRALLPRPRAESRGRLGRLTSKIEILLHRDPTGEPTEIEIRDVWLFSHYD